MYRHYREELVVLIGQFTAGRNHLRLLLGDRACLSTVTKYQLPVLTADRVWREMEKELCLDIQVIR